MRLRCPINAGDCPGEADAAANRASAEAGESSKPVQLCLMLFLAAIARDQAIRDERGLGDMKLDISESGATSRPQRSLRLCPHVPLSVLEHLAMVADGDARQVCAVLPCAAQPALPPVTARKPGLLNPWPTAICVVVVQALNLLELSVELAKSGAGAGAGTGAGASSGGGGKEAAKDGAIPGS